MLTPVNPDSVLDLGSPTAPADGPTSSLTVSNNTFTLQGLVAGFNLHGNIVSGTISNNVIRGATPQPVIGLLIGGLDAATTVHITGNLLTGFNGGIITDSLANTTGVSASQNCIYANTTAASTGTGGNPFIATNNWWGATNGPGPSGSGNPVSGNVTVTPFLATAAAICSPVTTLAVGQPSAISGGATDVSTTTPITLSSLVAPATASTIAHVYYRFFLQASTPPGFTSVAGHTASFMLSGANGTYTVQDYAVDAAGNVEATHSTTLVLTTLVPGLDVAGSTGGSAPTTGSPDTGYQAPSGASNPALGATGATGAHNAATGQGSSPSKAAPLSGLPWWAYAGLGTLLLLVVLGGASFLFLRSNKRQKPA
jgi:hypothetical protein